MINRDFHNAYINIIHDSKALCLSYFDESEDKPDPLYENLMWSHYADGLRGFCNVFDCDILFNNLTKLKIRPALVQYLDKPLTLKIDSYAEYYVLKNDFSKAISEAVPTISSKSLKWSYEREIRLLSTEKKNLISYPSNALIEIVIGEKMPVDEQKQVILNARTANPDVVIKTARLKPNTYQLEIIDYIEPKNN